MVFYQHCHNKKVTVTRIIFTNSCQLGLTTPPARDLSAAWYKCSVILVVINLWTTVFIMKEDV